VGQRGRLLRARCYTKNFSTDVKRRESARSELAYLLVEDLAGR